MPGWPSRAASTRSPGSPGSVTGCSGWPTWPSPGPGRRAWAWAASPPTGCPPGRTGPTLACVQCALYLVNDADGPRRAAGQRARGALSPTASPWRPWPAAPGGPSGRVDDIRRLAIAPQRVPRPRHRVRRGGLRVRPATPLLSFQPPPAGRPGAGDPAAGGARQHRAAGRSGSPGTPAGCSPAASTSSAASCCTGRPAPARRTRSATCSACCPGSRSCCSPAGRSA